MVRSTGGGSGRNYPTGGLVDLRRRWAAVKAGPVFGAALVALREARGETRADIQGASGLSYQQMRGLEDGLRWPSDQTLTQVSASVQLTPSTLIELRNDLLTRLEAARDSTTGPDRQVAMWLAALGEQVAPPYATVTGRDEIDVQWVREGRHVIAFEIKKDHDRVMLYPFKTEQTPRGAAESIVRHFNELQNSLLYTNFNPAGSLDTHASAGEFRKWTKNPADTQVISDQIDGLTSRERSLVAQYVQLLIDSRPTDRHNIEPGHVDPSGS